MNRTFGQDGEITRRLEAYAVMRLSPDPLATARSRAAVMQAASVALAGPGPVASGQPIPLRDRRPILGRPRRAVAALLAAALSVLLLAGVSLAAGPGGPLYGVRLWAETISLPSEPDARADADVDRLDARVDEAVGAARNGNGSAVSAALAAYRDILQDALDAAGQGAAADVRLQGAIDRHRIIFAALLENAPDPAKPAIQRALEKSDEAAKGLGNANGNPGGGKPDVRPTPKPGGGHGPDATPKGGPEKSPRGRPSSGKPGG